ncbi:metal ABC transporter substrate-binding protein [uncultured Clostridium sp.]|jgi:zinc transport system substrate-binding protein|uniref:metal ABC transporter substrate-binding protein n=1 Tax=uncultured Clostridium sp. TaxID=59620 RepID=UPI00261F13E7|nr:metal ABC transporter substrate-binding protein [uncultured Clostridium sp.]
MKKKLIFGAIISVLVLGFAACTTTASAKVGNKKEDSGKIKVMTSIYPVKEFTEIIGGDKVSVTSMVPDNAEPHDFEPKAKDMVELSKANLFIYNGLGMEHWVDKVLETVNSDKITVVNTSKNAKIIAVSDEEEAIGHDHEHTEGDGHDHGRIDPHIWLSFTEAKSQAKLIEEGLIKVDPTNKDYYTANYNKLAEQLDSISTEYGEKFKTLSNKNFVTGHAAFAYLCRDLGLTQKSVEDAFGEGEVTPQHLKELSEYCKANNVKVIFMPDSASEKISQTLANEVGAKVVKISSLETKNGDKSYIETMKENLETIYNNLK